MSLQIAACLYIDKSGDKGRGVYTSEDLPENAIIEISPVLVMSADDRKHLDQTPLHDYIFEWGAQQELCCVAWGYLSMYNHSYTSNCEYYMDFDQQVIMIKTVSNIRANEELLINYNGDWNDSKPLWFEAK
ncbi:SET domain-containing protein-lysine N-methyltransferase [Taibaiella sp. KBW10]|uniref:SET domain-containing protein n=1 Tax=Taibaiella sp. KBW10 TaxID=2153357 RepID=UPI000F595D45|nr:SET domain-containing protein [Taibaiella sp. KBW10]RQO30524.1 SET domain-containing protein-lysine N-methyltransferase [Taibaiella sp. KBW10]